MLSNFIKSLRSNKKNRMLALAAVITLLALAKIAQMLYLEEPATKGQISLMCTKCKFAIVSDAGSADHEKCQKCGAQMGLHYKCSACDFEFAFIPKPLKDLKGLSPNDLRLFRINEMKCPNCGSTKVMKYAQAKRKSPAVAN